MASDPLSVYLEEAGRVPLLDSRQEVRLAKELARARKALQSLAGTIPQSLDPRVGGPSGDKGPRGREWSVGEAYRFCDELVRRCGERQDARARAILREVHQHKARLSAAREKLITANLRLVVHIAKKFPNHGLALLDLVQEGNLGLLKAVERFRYSRRNRFSTYAYWWIKQSIERAISNQGRAVRVPVHVLEKRRRIRQVSSALSFQLRREPCVDEIAKALKLSRCKVDDIVRAVRDEDPLEDAEREVDHLSRTADRSTQSPFRHVLGTQLRDHLESAVESLEPKERQVIRLRYGLGCDARPTLESVGDAVKLSRERVRQIEKSALAKIGSHPRTESLLESFEQG
jgi:RNA polymerase primary sigma factor